MNGTANIPVKWKKYHNLSYKLTTEALQKRINKFTVSVLQSNKPLQLHFLKFYF